MADASGNLDHPDYLNWLQENPSTLPDEVVKRRQAAEAQEKLEAQRPLQQKVIATSNFDELRQVIAEIAGGPEGIIRGDSGSQTAQELQEKLDKFRSSKLGDVENEMRLFPRVYDIRYQVQVLALRDRLKFKGDYPMSLRPMRSGDHEEKDRDFNDNIETQFKQSIQNAQSVEELKIALVKREIIEGSQKPYLVGDILDLMDTCLKNNMPPTLLGLMTNQYEIRAKFKELVLKRKTEKKGVIATVGDRDTRA